MLGTASVYVDVDLDDVIDDIDSSDLIKEIQKRGYKVFGEGEEPRRTTTGQNLYQDMVIIEVNKLLKEDRLTVDDYRMLQNPNVQISIPS